MRHMNFLDTLLIKEVNTVGLYLGRDSFCLSWKIRLIRDCKICWIAHLLKKCGICRCNNEQKKFIRQLGQLLRSLRVLARLQRGVEPDILRGVLAKPGNDGRAF